MTPYRMSKLLDRALGDKEITVTEQERARWLESPCTTAIFAFMLERLGATWEAMTAATSWEQFCGLRGGYRAIEGLLEFEAPVSAEEFTAPDTARKIQKQLEELNDE